MTPHLELKTHDELTLSNDAVAKTHDKLEIHVVLDVIAKIGQGNVQALLFGIAAVVESDFFRVADDPRVYEPEMALELLLLGGQRCHGAPESRQYEAGEHHVE
jgi:hypothetical protein